MGGATGHIFADVIGNRPAFGMADRYFWSTDEHILYRDTGAAWVKVAVADYPDLDSIPVAVTTGQYTGDDSVNRAIPHGLGVTPKVVVIHRSDIAYGWHRITDQTAAIFTLTHTVVIKYTVTAMDATNFYVGNATSYINSANYNSYVYDWVAIR